MSVRLKLRNVFRRRAVERELDDEVRYHLERQIDDFIARGLTPDDARYAALRQFNGLEQRKEECRDARGIGWIEKISRDLKYAVRGLLRNPAYTCAVILTLGLGIGANAAVFTIVHSVLLRQLPFRNADRLVWVWSTRTDRDKAFYSILNFTDTRRDAQKLEDMAAFANWGVNWTGTGEAERLTGVRITANAFELLGVRASAGRLLLPTDGTPEASRVVVISDGLWRRRFGADPNITGRSMILNGTSYVIAGVLPSDFAMPNAQVDIATPLVFETDPLRSDRGWNFLRAFALLKAGVTPQQAQAELAAITERLKQQFPNANAKHTAPRVITLRDEAVGSYDALLWTLAGAVMIVLLIACANLTNISVVRAAARSRDFAIRAALGETRAEFIRESLVTGWLLALFGGAIGIGLAFWGVRLLIAIGPADLPRLTEIALDSRTAVFAACVSLVAGTVIGLIPAFHAWRTDIDGMLKSSGKSSRATTIGLRARRVFVGVEVAFSVLLLIAGGLLIRSFMKLQSVSSGVDARNVLTVRISLPASKYADADTINVFATRLIEDSRHNSGVESASMISVLPLSGMNTRSDFTIAGRPPATQAERPAAQNRWVAPDYFHTMRIPLIRGREFTDLDTDRAQTVIVVDQALADRYFPGEDPMGKHLRLEDGRDTREAEIVGVVGNVKHFALNEAPIPTYYSPIAQVPPVTAGLVANGLSLVVRTGIDPLVLAEPIRHQIQSLDADVAASAAQSMDQLLAASIAPRRFNLLLMEVFAIAALVLAATGLYSLIAYAVVLRRHEIGIRMALGANARDVFRQTIREGMILTLIGETVGVAGAFVVTRLLAGLLFEVTPTDPTTFLSVITLLGLTAFLACYIPAFRATRIDPSIALRND